MAFDVNQRRLLTGGSDGVLRFWNANNGSVLREVGETFSHHLRCLFRLMPTHIGQLLHRVPHMTSA